MGSGLCPRRLSGRIRQSKRGHAMDSGVSEVQPFRFLIIFSIISKQGTKENTVNAIYKSLTSLWKSLSDFKLK